MRQILAELERGGSLVNSVDLSKAAQPSSGTARRVHVND
jgi:hypothetical protein